MLPQPPSQPTEDVRGHDERGHKGDIGPVVLPRVDSEIQDSHTLQPLLDWSDPMTVYIGYFTPWMDQAFMIGVGAMMLSWSQAPYLV